MAISARIDELKKKFDENPRRYFAPLANEYRKSGDPGQAIFICEAYLPQQPGHMSGHIVFGQALYELGRLDDARAVFETALSLDPENLIALRHLGDIARQQNDFPAARQWFERVLEADPRNDEIAQIVASLANSPAGPASAPTPAAASSPEATIPPQSSAPTAQQAAIRPEQAAEMRAAAQREEEQSRAATASHIEAVAPPPLPPPPVLSSAAQEIPPLDLEPAQPATTSSSDQLFELEDLSFGNVDLSGSQVHAEPASAGAQAAEPADLEQTVELGMGRAVDEAEQFQPDPFAITSKPAENGIPEVSSVSDEFEATFADFTAPAAPDPGFDVVGASEQELAAAGFETFSIEELSSQSNDAPVAEELAETSHATAEPEIIADEAASSEEPTVEIPAARREPEAVAEPETEPLAAESVDNPSASPMGEPDFASVSELLVAEIEPISASDSTVDEAVAESSAAAPLTVDLGEPHVDVAPASAEATPASSEAISESLESAQAATPPSIEAISEEATVSDVATPEAPAVEAAGTPETAAQIPEPETPAVEAEPPAAPEAFVTETMAELYLQQGHLDSALDIYRKLVEQRPGDSQLRDRLGLIERRIQGPAAEPRTVEAPEPIVEAGPTIRDFLGALLGRAGSQTPVGTDAVSPVDSTMHGPTSTRTSDFGMNVDAGAAADFRVVEAAGDAFRSSGAADLEIPQEAAFDQLADQDRGVAEPADELESAAMDIDADADSAVDAASDVEDDTMAQDEYGAPMAEVPEVADVLEATEAAADGVDVEAYAPYEGYAEPLANNAPATDQVFAGEETADTWVEQVQDESISADDASAAAFTTPAGDGDTEPAGAIDYAEYGDVEAAPPETPDRFEAAAPEAQYVDASVSEVVEYETGYEVADGLSTESVSAAIEYEAAFPPSMTAEAPVVEGEIHDESATPGEGSIEALFGNQPPAELDSEAATSIAQAFAPDNGQPTSLFEYAPDDEVEAPAPYDGAETSASYESSETPASYESSYEGSYESSYENTQMPTSEPASATPVANAPVEAASGPDDGFSFDQFFAEDVQDTTPNIPRESEAAPGDAADVAQFNQWLNRLKKT